ncbi:MAG TPA: bifunctional phosphoglucose/phosphomannose isomerase [Thermoleophilaceae bacterium]|jgi:glucose/mannose-6-phosphate isomerase
MSPVELSPEAIAAADPSNMVGDVLAQPEQLRDAVWRAESAGLPHRHAPGGLVVAGMGGSAVGGDLAAAILGARAAGPVRTVRGYDLEPWVGPDTLVLCASYSGDTEETLVCFEAAGAAGAPRAVVTTGGQLGAAAREAGVPVIGAPAGFQPRAAVAYMTVAALEAAAACAAGPSLRAELEAAAALLGDLVREWGPDAPPGSEAKALAAAIAGSLPVVYGAGRTAAVARRWKTQLNENANTAAFASELPEADHNEVCGYEADAASSARPAAVFLDDDGLDERLRRRIALTAQLVEPGAALVRRVEARGQTPAERVLSLVLLGDLASVYLAVLTGVDPTPVPAIDRLKRLLG